jgi:phosphate transport system permease protein
MSALATESASAAVLAGLRGHRRDVRGIAFAGVLLLALLLSLGFLGILMWDVAKKGAPVLADRGSGFLTNPNSSLASQAGIGQALLGSAALMAIVALVAFPIGIGAAVYLEEYARDSWLTRFIAANIRNLAGVPSIVYGILGLVIFVEAMKKIATIWSTGSLLSGGLTLSVLVLPIVVITTSEAIRAVPQGIREAAYGVGATRWEVIRSHVLPSAAPGIVTGTAISLGRAFGETAPLLLVGAVRGFFSVGNANFVGKILNAPYTALPITVLDWLRRPNQAAFEGLAAAAILVMMTLLLVVNGFAIWLRNRYERKW